MHLVLDVDRLGVIEDYCQRNVAAKQFPGIAWRIEFEGQSSAVQVVGFSDHQLSRPLRDDQIFRIYSMTKPLISMLSLMLVERGLLRLGDPVKRWIPSLHSQKVLDENKVLSSRQRDITVEDLLSHRAGFSYDFLPDCEVATEYRKHQLAEDGGRSLAELVSILADQPLARQPGSCWYYSYATDVLAYVLECVADQPIRQLLRELILKPLGMLDTDYGVDANNQSRLADMFGQRNLGEVPDNSIVSNQLDPMHVDQSYPSKRSDTYARGGIGLFSTVNDYFEFVRALQTGLTADGKPLLSWPMVEFMWCNRLSVDQMPIGIAGSSYPGYGWNLVGRVMCDTSQAIHLTSPGEGGWGGAASTYFWTDRQLGFSGVVMTQYLGSAIPLGSDIQSLAYGALVEAR